MSNGQEISSTAHTSTLLRAKRMWRDLENDVDFSHMDDVIPES